MLQNGLFGLGGEVCRVSSPGEERLTELLSGETSSIPTVNSKMLNMCNTIVHATIHNYHCFFQGFKVFCGAQGPKTNIFNTVMKFKIIYGFVCFSAAFQHKIYKPKTAEVRKYLQMHERGPNFN